MYAIGPKILWFNQGGRARADFSLAWLKQPDIPVEVDTGRLETDVGRQEFKEIELSQLSLAKPAKV